MLKFWCVVFLSAQDWLCLCVKTFSPETYLPPAWREAQPRGTEVRTVVIPKWFWQWFRSHWRSRYLSSNHFPSVSYSVTGCSWVLRVHRRSPTPASCWRVRKKHTLTLKPLWKGESQWSHLTYWQITVSVKWVRHVITSSSLMVTSW